MRNYSTSPSTGINDLILDNSQLEFLSVIPSVGFYVKMADDLAWLKQRKSGTTVLGPKLIPELYTDAKPMMTDIRSWRVHSDMLALSPRVNWRFTNLNKAFQTMAESAARPLLVFSDVCHSGVVGNQMTDVLREIQYAHKGKGSSTLNCCTSNILMCARRCWTLLKRKWPRPQRH